MVTCSGVNGESMLVRYGTSNRIEWASCSALIAASVDDGRLQYYQCCECLEELYDEQFATETSGILRCKSCNGD